MTQSQAHLDQLVDHLRLMVDGAIDAQSQNGVLLPHEVGAIALQCLTELRDFLGALDAEAATHGLMDRLTLKPR
jgi:hypothetical protein